MRFVNLERLFAGSVMLYDRFGIFYSLFDVSCVAIVPFVDVGNRYILQFRNPLFDVEALLVEV